jgi:hypothetical protein
VASPAISELVRTIEVVRTMRQTLADLAKVVELIGGRVERLERELEELKKS